MSWSDIFPILTDEMVRQYQEEATKAEKKELGGLFEVSEVLNRQESDHVMVTTLFWKPASREDSDYPSPSRELMENPAKAGLSSRFSNAWQHYVQPLFDGALVIKKQRPEVCLRVYLANDLSFIAEELVEAGWEVRVMKSSSIRANPGAMWRFLAMEDGVLATMSDSDQAVFFLDDIERTEAMAEGGLKYWRRPYQPGPGEWNHKNPGVYRTTNAIRLGAALKLPVRQLAEAMLWNLEKGDLATFCKVGERRIPIFGSGWPDYGFDEYFLNTAIYPRVAKEGILTLLDWRRMNQTYWFALDIEHCMKENPQSEIIHYGQPWRDDIPDLEWTEEEVDGFKNFLSAGQDFCSSEAPLLSVCVSLKNRSRIPSESGFLESFPRGVEALAELHDTTIPMELVVADFRSDDWPLEEWLREAAREMPVTVLDMGDVFSKGKGINAAVAIARSPFILLLDADVRIVASGLLAGVEQLSKGVTFFPIIQDLDPKGKHAQWAMDSLGCCFLTKETFEKSGGVREYRSWGGEDDLFFKAVMRVSSVERFKVKGFRHQWHPDRCRHENYSGSAWEDFGKDLH
ncbi:MAG: glycosyltransferase family 2 protein [Akkermansiaceae bacterium]